MKKFKIVLVGNTAVGKTSIANRFTRNIFANRYLNTLGCDFYIKNVNVDTGNGTEECKLILLDIGGLVELRESRRKYMENADIAFVVVALNDPGSLEVDEFIDDIQAISSKPIFAIVGNKLDLVEKEDIDPSGIKAIADKHNVPFFLTSAKENIMISEMFLDMVNRKIMPS